MNEVFEGVKKAIVERLGIEEAKVTMEASFIKDLGADSLDTYDLLFAFEEEFGIEVPDEEASQFTTVGDVVNFIAKIKK